MWDPNQAPTSPYTYQGGQMKPGLDPMKGGPFTKAPGFAEEVSPLGTSTGYEDYGRGGQMLPRDEQAENFELLRALAGDRPTSTEYANQPWGQQNLNPMMQHALVYAWRMPESVAWTPQSAELAVVHKPCRDGLHFEVQFLKDQARLKLPKTHFWAVDQSMPAYKPVWLKPDDLLPSMDEALQMEQQQQRARDAYMRQHGIAMPEPQDGGMKERLRHEAVRWAMPENTTWALRNRSIPASQVSGKYGPHVYSRLYKANFWADEKPQGGLYEMARGKAEKAAARPWRPRPQKPGASAPDAVTFEDVMEASEEQRDFIITKQSYVPLHGPALVWKEEPWNEPEGGRWVCEHELQDELDEW